MSHSSEYAAQTARYVLPNIIERTSRGEYGMDPYSKLLKERIVFLGVQIDDVSANDVMAQRKNKQ